MIGHLIGGHIRILGALGQGGMGDVYSGLDERLGRKVAVKTIRADRSASTRQRFLREARALSALDHPNICRLFEYIESLEGDFLVLELIEGVTLTRAIERGMSRARKLSAATDILAALGAAHRKGIVHRDLKPDNVMISNDGVVKVLDFGIAFLETLDDDASVAALVPIDDASTLIYPIAASQTPERRSPVIAGTPLYMSPEQAAGAEVSIASDLYSFGLLLQTLLTEEPPHDKSISREELLARVSRGESLSMTGQPRDLTALVDSLKSVAPENRPSAAEARSVLEGIVDKPRRRMRVAAAMMVLAVLLAGAAKYAVDVTRARREAERRRGQAEDLVRFMVGDLRAKLEPLGRLDVLDDVAARALAYFATLRPEEMTGEALNRNSLALAQLGQTRVKQAKLPEAIGLLRQSVRFASAAVARDPSNDEWQMTLSNAHFWLGDSLRRQGDVPGTFENFRAYAAIAKELAARHPSESKYQAEVSYAHGNLGAAHELAADEKSALAEYRQAFELDRERSRREPRDEQWQADLANSANRLGVILQKSGDLQGALDAFDQDLAARRRLAQSKPDDARRKQRLAASLAFAGRVHKAMGDMPRAVACYREELAIAEALAARDPSNADAKRNRSVAASRLAVLLEPAEGLPLAQRGLNDMREVVRADGRVAWRRDLAAALYLLANVYRRSHDLTRAADHAAEAIAIGETLVAEHPKDQACLRHLSEALLEAAAIDEARGDTALARDRRSRAADAARRADGHRDRLRDRKGEEHGQ